MSTENPSPSRRDLMKGVALAAAATTPFGAIALATMESNSYVSLLRTPDLVRAFGPDFVEVPLHQVNPERWEGDGVAISVSVHPDHTALSLQSHGKVSRIQFRWRGDLREVKKFLGDHWERSYADLEWRGDSPNRTMPWYFMTTDGHHTHGYGVRTHPKAFLFWNADFEGISLWADVRSGGVPVELGDRILEVAKVVCRQGKSGESAFAATQAFCRQMCPMPKLPLKPVYGTNDWNYAYGNNSADLIERVSNLISELSPSTDNRPYSVIDEGWAMGPYNNNFGHGPWFGNPRFGDMGAFATKMKGIGVRPGIWFRALTPLPDTPSSWRLDRNSRYLDPTIPEVKQHIASHVKRFVDWGYEMVKHDYTTWDLFGEWGFEMGPSPTRDGWHLHNRSITNAEAILDLYKVMHDSAGKASLIGCNTVSHLAPGFHELQRTGDDTSGRSWNRNRRMGVNTLAFRGPQHRAFYEVDPDIVSITKAVPWHLVEQWLRLVSESGVALFVAIEPSVIEAKHRVALKRAFEIAAKPQRTGEPLDWLDSMCPSRWNLLGKKVDFNWMGESGAWPFSD